MSNIRQLEEEIMDEQNNLQHYQNIIQHLVHEVNILQSTLDTINSVDVEDTSEIEISNDVVTDAVIDTVANTITNVITDSVASILVGNDGVITYTINNTDSPLPTPIPIPENTSLKKQTKKYMEVPITKPCSSTGISKKFNKKKPLVI